MHVPRATLAIYFHKEIKLDSFIALSVTMVGIYIGPSLSGGDGFEGTNPSCRPPAKPGVWAGLPARRVSAQLMSSASQLRIPWGYQAARMDTRQ